MAFYLKHLNRYGLPLDNREDYTKLDWSIWTATLADNASGLERHPGADRALDQRDAPPAFLSQTGTTPKPAHKSGFQARSVVGGVYIKALADRSLAEKWRNRHEP